MKRKVLVLVPLLVVAAIAATTGTAQQRSIPTLHATVGPGYTITLKRNGSVVKTLKAGTYKLVIADKAKIHSFSLDGPHGFARDFTTVPFVGTKTFTLNLKRGTYKYYCPPHEAMMFAHFKGT
jgi:plastocyanin